MKFWNFWTNVVWRFFPDIVRKFFPNVVQKLHQKWQSKWGNFLRASSESVNIFRISVVVSNLNSGYLDNSKFFFEVNSKYSDNSKFFSGVIRSIQTIWNFFPMVNWNNSKFFSGVNSEFRTDLRILCGKNMAIHQNPFFSRKYFFSNSEKSEYSEFYFPSYYSEFPATG